MEFATFHSLPRSPSDAMPCNDPDEEINQLKMPDPKLWAKKGRVNSNPDGEEEEAQTMIKSVINGGNGMGRRSMLPLRNGLRANVPRWRTQI